MHQLKLVLSSPFLLLALFSCNWGYSQPAVVSSISTSELAEFDDQSDDVQKLISSALSLTQKDLAYTFGSASPSKGGMDCSGTICHLLKSLDLPEVPRMSHTIYLWVQEYEQLTRLNHVYSPKHPTLRLMQPGDLVFWEGTYAVEDRNPPISHVMLYLGTLKKDGQGVLFGASSGRRFRGKKIHGVSVFDFKVPSESSKAKLVGFGPVPGVRNSPPKSSIEPPATVNRGDGKSSFGKILKVFTNKPAP